MALVIEDGSIVSGANSYASEAELSAYAVARGITLSGDPEQLLIKAMDYIEGLPFKGIKMRHDQAVQWPRSDVWIDHYFVSADEIPQLLKDSQMEVAVAIDQGEDPLANIPRRKQSATVGPVSVTYEPGSATTTVRRISNKLQKLLSGGVGGSSFIVRRG